MWCRTPIMNLQIGAGAGTRIGSTNKQPSRHAAEIREGIPQLFEV
jgi:hypothetical protein